MYDSDHSADGEEADGTYRVSIAEHENPSEAVVRATMAVTNAELGEIDPLYERIDPEALDAVFEDGRTTRRGTVYFEYCECEIAVEDGERISLRPPNAGGSASD